MHRVLYLKTELVAKDILELSTKACSGERQEEAGKQYRETLTICKRPALHAQYCQNIFRRKTGIFPQDPALSQFWGPTDNHPFPLLWPPFLPPGSPFNPKRSTLPFPGQRSGLQQELLLVLLGWVLSWVKIYSQKSQRHCSHLSQG